MNEKSDGEGEINRESEEEWIIKILRIALGIVKSGKNQGDTSKIFTCIIVVFLVLGLLNYQKEIYVKLSKFKLSTDVNYYEILEASNGATDH